MPDLLKIYIFIIYVNINSNIWGYWVFMVGPFYVGFFFVGFFFTGSV